VNNRDQTGGTSILRAFFPIVIVEGAAVALVALFYIYNALTGERHSSRAEHMLVAYVVGYTAMYVWSVVLGRFHAKWSGRGEVARPLFEAVFSAKSDDDWRRLLTCYCGVAGPRRAPRCTQCSFDVSRARVTLIRRMFLLLLLIVGLIPALAYSFSLDPRLDTGVVTTGFALAALGISGKIVRLFKAKRGALPEAASREQSRDGEKN
jgi:hypothetical protein